MTKLTETARFITRRVVGGTGRTHRLVEVAGVELPLNAYRVLAALEENPRATKAELAELLGLSPRTIRNLKGLLYKRGLLLYRRADEAVVAAQAVGGEQ